LRKDVLIGALKPGTRMAQQQLCEQFGTSRMPVRDALKVLVAEGLLVTDVSQHVIVAPLSREDMLDAFEIEGELAGIAASRATVNASDADLDHLLSLHKAMLRATKANAQAEIVELNWALHRSINRLAESRKIIAALKIASLDLPRQFLGRLPGWDGRSNQEHEAIVAAMRDRNGALVHQLMHQHIVGFGEGMIRMLEAEGLELI